MIDDDTALEGVVHQLAKSTFSLVKVPTDDENNETGDSDDDNTIPISSIDYSAEDSGITASYEQWYKSFISEYWWDTAIVGDIFDVEQKEVEIQDFMSKMAISNGYCPNCRALFNALPDAIHNIDYIPLQLPCFESAAELVAASRSGCRLCILFIQEIKPEILDLTHRVEKRLDHLKKPKAISFLFGGFGKTLRSRNRMVRLMPPGMSLPFVSLQAVPVKSVGKNSLA